MFSLLNNVYNAMQSVGKDFFLDRDVIVEGKEKAVLHLEKLKQKLDVEIVKNLACYEKESKRLLTRKVDPLATSSIPLFRYKEEISDKKDIVALK